MENRKRKTSRRAMTRRFAYNHGIRSFKPQTLETSFNTNFPMNNNTNSKQRNRGTTVTSSTASSTSMRAFNFNVDSLGRNPNFITIPKESTDRRIVHKTPMYKNPTAYNLLLQSTYLLGGVNYDLGLEKSQLSTKLTSDYFRFLKKLSGKSTPSDRDIVFGNGKTLLKQASSGWENSRIQWLLDLERRQEMRRTKAQLCEEDYVNLCCFPFSANMIMWNTE